MVNSVDSQPSFSGLPSWMHLLIYLYTPHGFISPNNLLNFLLNLYISPRFKKYFKFIIFRLLKNAFMNQKIESRHLYSCPQAKSPLERGKLLNPLSSIFFKNFQGIPLTVENTELNQKEKPLNINNINPRK